ncbi:MAG: ATP-binding cassette domain-containing protein [Bacteriovoracaceae bacterium]|nr:ATP-binding cassette domain-containing protein [Bacteriovoracaceae bacterium]
MISVKNLTKIYGPDNYKAVDNISFQVPEGSIACIIGTSGCGKTTTLKMINRLIEPTSGEIMAYNDNAKDYNPIHWRRKMGFVIQKAGLLPHLTVKENICLLSRILKRKETFIDKRVESLLETVGLDPSVFKSRYPVELSGGQQQRIGIARALMEDPPIMLMDEPFGALDPITRNSLHEEFTNLNQELKKTILIVTHDLEEAFKLGDQVILMDQGKIVQAGNKEDFLKRPATNFVKEFVGDQINT